MMKQLSTAVNRRDEEAQSYFSAALRLFGLYLPNPVTKVQVSDTTVDAIKNKSRAHKNIYPAFLKLHNL